MGARQALEAQAAQPVVPAAPLASRNLPAPRLRTRSTPIANVESTKACSRAMSFSAVGRRRERPDTGRARRCLAR